MTIMDFSRHNEEVQQVWAAYHAGKPVRTPMVLATNPRIWIQDPRLNTEGLTWKEFCTDPEQMFQSSLKYKEHLAFNIPFDQIMGVPPEHWTLDIVFGNVVEEAWFGAEIRYPEGQVSATVPPFTGAHKHDIFQQGIPDPFAGIMAEQRRFYEYFVERAASSEFHGKAVKVSLPTPTGTDGPLTIANGLRGFELFEDMLQDPDYFHELMGFITEAIIRRIQAWRSYLGIETNPPRAFLADDAVEFLSVRSYREHVLPYHRKILETLWGAGPHTIHLCGNAQRHFPTLVKELNIRSFDTGFPIQFNTLRDEVGDEVEIQGGIQVTELMVPHPEKVLRRSAEILNSGIRRGGRFIFREANNLPPMVPSENIQAMYSAVKEYGKF